MLCELLSSYILKKCYSHHDDFARGSPTQPLGLHKCAGRFFY